MGIACAKSNLAETVLTPGTFDGLPVSGPLRANPAGANTTQCRDPIHIRMSRHRQGWPGELPKRHVRHAPDRACAGWQRQCDQPLRGAVRLRWAHLGIAPGTLNGNTDYLFFLASGTYLSGGIGTVVLSGGQVFRQPFPEARSPVVADGNPAHQDTTFDLDYAPPGSVVSDPTAAPGSMIMIYEGANDAPAMRVAPKRATARISPSG